MIDLTKLPPPDVLEAIDYESIYAGKLTRFQRLYPDWSAALESDPVVKLLELSAYDEMMYRARVNDAARSVMLAYANGSDLEHLSALLDTQRLLVTPADPEADPPVEAVYESNDRLRYRAQMAMEGTAAAGPRDAYRVHALSASGRVRDAWADRPAPGVVRVTVLSTDGEGEADAALLATVDDYLSADVRRPLSDDVRVQSAEIVRFTVDAVLHVGAGPAASVVRDAAERAVWAYVRAEQDDGRTLGRAITMSALYAALHQPGVSRVDLRSPADTLDLDRTEAAYCTAVTVRVEQHDD